jgi:hypothetical protein
MTGYRTGAVLAAVVIMLLGGCAFLQPQPHPVAMATKTYRDPTQADLATIEQRIMSLDHVTVAHVTYFQGVFGGSGSTYSGDVTSDATDRATLSTILDGGYKVIWTAPGVTAGVVNLVVKNPATGEAVSFGDLGFSGPPAAPDLESRYGPRP